MKYKHIEASREVRLWITQVAIPVGLAIAYFQNQEVKEKVQDMRSKVKTELKTVINRW